MNAKEFIISNRNDAQMLSKQIELYRLNKSLIPDSLFSLVDAYDFSYKHHESGKLWSALFDFYLYVTELELGLDDVIQFMNKDNISKFNESNTILTDPKLFGDCMVLHRVATEYTLKHRAAWDKLMGLIILILIPSEYSNFIDSSKKLKSFKSVIKKIGDYGEIISQKIDSLVSDFNNRFRTAEAHNSGLWRKWAFILQDGEDDPRELMIDAHNEFLNQLDLVRHILKVNW